MNPFVSGAAWMIAMRWGMRFIGLFSTMILARLLTPADFGVIALAMVVHQMFNVLASVGVDLALMRRRGVERDYYDTAWTIQIVQGTLVGVVLALVAPAAASLVHEPRVVAVVWLLGLTSFIMGFRNIGTVAFRKDLDFGAEFRFQIYQKLVSFVVTVSLAFALRSYWAIALALPTAALANVVLSFVVHPYRPTLCVRRMRELWSFSQWILLSQMGFFLVRKADQFLVGNIAGTSAVGVYNVSMELATMASAELVMPLRRSLFPNLAALGDRPDEVRRVVLRVVALVVTVSALAAAGLMTLAGEFVRLVLGSQWLQAIPLLQWFSALGVVTGLSMALEVVLLVQGRGNLSTFAAWLEAAVLISLLWVLGHGHSVAYLARIRTFVGVGVLPVMLVLVTRVTSITLLDLLYTVWRPIASACAASAVVFWLAPYVNAPLVVAFLAKGTLVVVLFVGLSFALWVAGGRPGEAMEGIAVQWMGRRLAARRAG